MPKQPKPNPVGRPRLPKGNAKVEMLRIRVTPDELKAFEVMAKANKQTVSEWTRRILTDFKGQEDWNKVMRLFGNARDGYSKLGNQKKARECDQAIALVQFIALDPNL